MTWPPAALPIDFENATPQENTHPDAHNATNQTINADLVPEINRVGALADTIGLYLPLSGGTLTGELRCAGDSNLTIASYAQRGLIIDRTANPNVVGLVEFMPSYEAGATTCDIKVDGNGVVRFRGDKFSRFYGDLEVDGNLKVEENLVADGGVKLTKVVSGDDGTTATLRPNLYANSNGWLFKTSWTPSRMAFAPSKLTRDSDVLERAETATLPPEMQTDDDGNVLNTAEIEAHDTVQLFEVVTALLLKVKELSAEIEELKPG